MSRFCFLLLLLLSASMPARAAEPIATGLRVATCGHSFHVFTYGQVAQIAQSAGLAHQMVGLSSIGGSTVQRHWEVPEEKSAVKQVLKAGGADVLTLSPIWLPDPAIEEFVRLGLAHQPALRITVQEYWMPNDEYEPVYPLQTRKVVDHNATDLARLRDATQRYAHDIEAYVRGLNERVGRPAVFIVPVGLAAVTLREMIVRGEAPGLRQQSELFRDSWGHALTPLQLLSSCCHFAVIYRRSPVGLPVPPPLRKLENVSEEDRAKLNTLLQQIAWDTVSAHPMSGVGK